MTPYEREVRDLPCFEFRTTVVIELYRVRCPDCGVKTEKVPQLPSKAPIFPLRFITAIEMLSLCTSIPIYFALSIEGCSFLPRRLRRMTHLCSPNMTLA
jgi:hypothetical protein